MNVRVINNVEEFSHPFEWKGETYDIRYTVWTQMKITERFGGIGEFAEELSRVKNVDNIKSTELLLEVFAILLNQQIKIRNKEEKKNAFNVDAEYLMMSQTSEKIMEMISLTYEVLLEAFPKKEQNAAENELDTLAAKELGDEDGEENEKN